MTHESKTIQNTTSHKKTFLPIAIVVTLFFIAYLLFRITAIQPKQIVTDNCTPTFADGGGPYYKENAPFRKKIVPDKNNGEKLVIKGRVLQNDCNTPAPDAVIDIWQANENGNYEDEWYRGKITSDTKGRYEFETIIPKGYGEGTAFRPPHIHFNIFIDNKLVITSQMFFPGVEGKAGFDNAYIMNIEKKNIWGNTVYHGEHNIILP